MNNNNKNDFSIIFEEIERFHNENPSFADNGINDEDLHNDETIRAFSDICREISTVENNPVQYLTFV
jgi:hypothetical protein